MLAVFAHVDHAMQPLGLIGRRPVEKPITWPYSRPARSSKYAESYTGAMRYPPPRAQSGPGSLPACSSGRNLGDDGNDGPFMTSADPGS